MTVRYALLKLSGITGLVGNNWYLITYNGIYEIKL